MEGITKLIELLIQAKNFLKPWANVKPWETGGLLRWGKYHSALPPGYHWKIPVVDYVTNTETAITTLRLPPQTLDIEGKKLTVRGIVKYRLVDIEKYICDIYEEQNYLRDVAARHIKRWLIKEGLNVDVEKKIQRSVKDEATEGGYDIMVVELVEQSGMHAIRLMMDEGDEDLS